MGQFFMALGTAMGGTAAAGTAATGATTAGFTSASLAASTGGALGTGAVAGGTGFLGMGASTWSALGTGFSVLSDIRAGQAQKVQYDMQAEAERVQARDREIQRKQRLIAALASQNAARGAQGIRLQGSPAAMMKSDISEARFGSLIDRGNTSMKVRQYQQSGKHAMQSSYMSAGSSLLDYGTRRAERG